MFKYLRVINEITDNWGVTYIIGGLLPTALLLMIGATLTAVWILTFAMAYLVITMIYCLSMDDLLPSWPTDVTIKRLKKAWKETK